MDKIENLTQLFRASKWEEGTTLWLQMLEEGVSQLDPLRKATQDMWRGGQKDLALELIHHTISACSKHDNPALLVQALRLMADYNPNQKGLIENFCTAFKQLYQDHPHLPRWMEKVTSQIMPPAKLIYTLEKLAAFREGSIVQHKSGWGIGKIVSISQEKMEMIVNLEKRPNHRMDILAATDCLMPMDPENFDALVVFQPERLKEEANNRPLALIYKILKSNSEPISARELKQCLCPSVITEQQWNKWWTKVRKILISDPYIEANGEVNAKYSLRDKPLEWEVEIINSFIQTDALEQASVALDYLKTSTAKKHIEQLGQTLAKNCLAQHQAHKPWYALESYLVIQELRKQGAVVPEFTLKPEEILGEYGITIFSHLRLPALAQKSFELYMAYRPDWEDQLDVILKKGSDLARDTVFKYLNRESKQKKVTAICKEIIKNPLQLPDALMWFAKQIINERLCDDEIPNLFDLFQVLVQTVATLKSLRQTEPAKKIAKLFSISFSEKLSVMLDRTQASQTSKIMDSHGWLPGAFKESIYIHIRERYPDLFREFKPIFTTKWALENYRTEFEDLYQKKIPENQRAIGHALSFGDLSENAELDAAREIQWQLMQKVNEMKNNLERAVLIDFDAVSTTEVSIGTEVKLENKKTGEVLRYSILGPWDVNISQGIISYHSPIAKALLGLHSHDVAELPAGTFRIIEITKYDSVAAMAKN